MDALFQLVLLGIATGAISMVVSKSTLFNVVHDWIEPRFPKLEEMLSCPWCLSHWVALGFTLIYHPLVVRAFLPVDYLVTVVLMTVVAAVTSWVIFSAYKPIFGDK